MLPYVIPILMLAVIGFTVAKDWKQHTPAGRFFLPVILAFLVVANVVQTRVAQKQQQATQDDLKERNQFLQRQIAIVQDQNRDILARIVQTVEQVRVSQLCTANPKGSDCKKMVGAELQRNPTASITFGATAKVEVKRANERRPADLK